MGGNISTKLVYYIERCAILFFWYWIFWTHHLINLFFQYIDLT